MAGNDSKNLGASAEGGAGDGGGDRKPARSDTPKPRVPRRRIAAMPMASAPRVTWRSRGSAAPLPRRRRAQGDAASGQSGLAVYAAEQEQALLRGERSIPAPLRQLNYSVQALWSRLLVAVRFREAIIGLIAVAPKSVAQVFTLATESLLPIANQAALALFCAGLSEQLEARRRTQEQLLHEQAELAMRCPGAPGPGRTCAGHAGGAVAGLQNTRRAGPSVRCGSVRRLRELIEQARLLRHERLRARCWSRSVARD